MSQFWKQDQIQVSEDKCLYSISNQCLKLILVKFDNGAYGISLAIAGFEREDVQIYVEKNNLIIKGELHGEHWEGEYVHQGIAKRNFERSFSLGEYMEVSEAEMKDGMLHILIEKNVPEEKKPKTIKIK